MPDLTLPPPPPVAPLLDIRLFDDDGPERALTEVAVPWRRAGAVTVVATPDGRLSRRTRARLEGRLGPVAVQKVDRATIDHAVARLAGPRLAHRAERRTLSAESCRDWSGGRTARIALTLLTLGALGSLLWPGAVAMILTIWAALTLLAVTGLRTAAALTELVARRRRVAPVASPLSPLPRISILVPLFREREIAGHLVKRLAAIDYPRDKLDILLVLEDDDDLTKSALDRATLPLWMRVLPVPEGSIRTKPRALNYAMDFATGDIIGVYDAEDWPAPDQLTRVAAHFDAASPNVACIQGVLDFYNAGTNWLTRCFTIDYATWFRLVLPGLARMGLVIPLGGTTLFFKADVLRRLGRWDAHNVTEDADLGIRLARHGYRTEFLASVTEEEATASIPAWIRQRSRWIKGYAVTWAVHMRAPLRLWAELGTWRFLGVQILFLGTLSQFVLAPVLWSFWLVLLGFGHPFTDVAGAELVLGLTILFFACEVATIGINALGVAGQKHRWLIKWVPLMHLYFPLAAIASWKGYWELISRPFYWDKTAHGRTIQPKALKGL